MKNFNSVEQILSQLEQQPGWEKFRDYRRLLKCWHQVVSQRTIKHTRPLQITRNVLWVATSSAAMAQELSFQRYSLLKRLNQQLPFTLKDIRFSTGGWTQEEIGDRSIEDVVLFRTSQQHKLTKSPTKPTDLKAQDLKQISSATQAKIAAQKYLTAMKKNAASSSLPVCPGCGCLTPIGEIERWSLCYLCTAQKWSQESSLPPFPKS